MPSGRPFQPPGRESASVIRRSRCRAALRRSSWPARGLDGEPAGRRSAIRACVFHGIARSAVKPTGGWSDVRSNNRRASPRRKCPTTGRAFPGATSSGPAPSVSPPSGSARGRCSCSLPWPAADCCRRTACSSALDRPGRLAVRRGLPDLAADPHPVHRPAADPAGGHAADAGRGGGAAAAARVRASVSRTRSATRRTSSGRTRSGSRTRSSTSSTCSSVRTRSPRRRCMPIDKDGKNAKSFDAAGNTYPAGHRADAAAEHDLRLQRHVPRSADQRRVRQAGPGPVREPPGREPAEPGPAGLRLAGLLVPDPPAQRAHRARVATATRTTRSCSARRPRVTRSSPSWTTCT